MAMCTDPHYKNRVKKIRVSAVKKFRQTQAISAQVRCFASEFQAESLIFSDFY